MSEEELKPASFRRASLQGFRRTPQDNDLGYLRRWAALYNLLRTIPNDTRFDMSYWGIRAKTPCNTAACAAGHAMLHPWFQEQGLELRTNWEKTRLRFDQPRFFGMTDWEDSPFSPDYVGQVTGTKNSLIDRQSPKMVSEVVMAWMRTTWPTETVDRYVAEMKGVYYDVEYVHRFAPWNREKTPPENEVKKP